MPILVDQYSNKINNYSNCPKDCEKVLLQAFKFQNKGHEDYIEAFSNEMNKQAT
jgi:hypothetical protein